MKQTHKIRKQSLLLNFTNEAEAMSWNRSASEFNERNIVPVLDRLFDHYSGKEEHFEIDRLEINVGAVTKENFLSELEKELEKKLDSIFQSRLTSENEYETEHARHHFPSTVKNQDKEAGKQTERAESSHWIDTFSYFLDYGTLPWNSRAQTVRILQKEITSIISLNGLEILNGLRQQLLNIQTRKRLYNQFTAAFNFQVLSRLFISEYRLLVKLHNELAAVSETAVLRNVTNSKTRNSNNHYEIVKWISLEASSKTDLWPTEFIEFYIKTIFRKDQPQANELLNHAVKLSARRRNAAVLCIVKYLKSKEFRSNNDFKSKERDLLNRENETAENGRKLTPENKRSKENRNELQAGNRQQTRIENTGDKPLKHAESINPKADRIRDKALAVKKEIREEEKGGKQKGGKEEGRKEEGGKINGKKEEGGKEKGEEVEVGKVARRKGNGRKDEKGPQNIKVEIQSLDIENRDRKNALAGTKTASENREQSQNEQLLREAAKEGKFPIEAYTKDGFAANAESYYVSHAGALLAWPYLSTLFRILGFTENNLFKNVRLQHRAVHLLAYMATGKIQSEEPKLLIAKVLCGMPLHMPVLKKSRLSKKEKAEVGLMLENLIANWTILKSTSVEGLRSSFFEREGKLDHDNGQWKMIVEQKSFDMLLDHLPYPVSIIRLPWMSEVLKVDWM